MNIEELMKLKLPEIFTLTDKDDFITVLSRYLMEKSDYDKDFSALSEAEKTFYLCCDFEQHFGMDGLFGFFRKYGGSPVLTFFPSCLQNIGADKTADICRKAYLNTKHLLSPDEKEYFEDRIKREDKLEKALIEFDKAIFKASENIRELCFNYAIKNKEQFT